MALRTDTVARTDAPPAKAAEVEARLEQLRARYPGAVLQRYLELGPVIHERAYVAPLAALIGDVQLHDEVSIWHGAILRADIARIEIRERSNIQDGSVVHLGDENPTFVAEEVVVGHRAVLHGCHVGAGALIGIGATILDGAKIGEGSVIGAGAVVPPGSIIPPRSLVLGLPGKVVRQLESTDEASHRALALKYVRLAHNYRNA